MAVAWSAGQKVEVVRSFPFTLSSSASSSSPSHPAVHVCYKLGSVIEATEEHAVVQFTVVGEQQESLIQVAVLAWSILAVLLLHTGR